MTLAVSRHRRSSRLRWIAVAVGVAVVAGAGTAAVALRSAVGCERPPLTLNVAASPDQYPVVSELAEQWSAGDRAIGDRCAEVAVQAMPSQFAAATLSPGWDEERDGTRPDVWMPDSSVWLTVAGARADAAELLPTETPPSLASSPVVLAMQQPMAEALGWPDNGIGWADLLGSFARGQTWEQFGHPEWGPLRLGISEPTQSTAGLAAVLTVLDLDADNTLSDEEMLGGITFTQFLTAYEEDTGELLRSYSGAEADPSGLPAGFPILERELAVYAADGAAVPLVPVYMREGTLFADYPYTVLQASWVDADRQELAGQFLEYLSGPAGQAAYAEAGFRAADHAADGGALLSPERGFTAEVASPARAPSAEGLSQLLGMWPVLLRPNNVLILLDTSGSMDNQVPGTDTTRLQLLQGAATQGLPLLNNQSVVGLWEFSTQLTPTTPYRELVPLGPAGEDVGDGVDRRQAMVGAIQGLSAAGGTGLYDTIHDGYLAMQEVWQPEAQNLLVVITDGRDEDHDGRSLPELLDDLGEAVQPDRPLPIIALAVGPEADAAALEQLTEVTGGRTVVARDEVSALQQVVLAFSGRIS
jgi:Ca-activated chloride channel family protein